MKPTRYIEVDESETSSSSSSSSRNSQLLLSSIVDDNDTKKSIRNPNTALPIGSNFKKYIPPHHNNSNNNHNSNSLTDIIMNVLRQRRSNTSLIQSMVHSRWNDGTDPTSAHNKSNNEDGASSNSSMEGYRQHYLPSSSVLTPTTFSGLQHSSSSSQQRSFLQTLLFSIFSMCLISFCTTILWMYEVPHYNTYYDANRQELSPYYSSSLLDQYQDSLSSSSTSYYTNHIRPPPLLPIGGGAKYYILTTPDSAQSSSSSSSSSSSFDAAANRRLEINHPSTTQQQRLQGSLDSATNSSRQQQQQQQQQKQKTTTTTTTESTTKTITFRQIAQQGSLYHRTYTSGGVADITSRGEVRTATANTVNNNNGNNVNNGVSKQQQQQQQQLLQKQKQQMLQQQQQQQQQQQKGTLLLTQQKQQPPILTKEVDAVATKAVEVDLDITTGRKTRFPSVDERVRVYMSNWYLPPCSSSSNNNINNDAFVEYNIQKGTATTGAADIEYMMFREVRTAREKIRGPLRTFIVDDTTQFDILRHLNYDRMKNECTNTYCKDFVKYLYPAMEREMMNAKNMSTIVPNTVLTYQFSDAEKTRAYNSGTNKVGGYPNIPNIKKFRYAISKEERERILSSYHIVDGIECSIAPRPIPITILEQQMIDEAALAHDETIKIVPNSQPIIMKLKIQRHYGYVENIPNQDIEWKNKKNQAIFRGQFTGRFPVGMSSNIIKELSPLEQCNLLHRCRLVYNAASNMKLIDAKLALPVLDVRKDFPQIINDVPLYGERVSIEDMLQYKAIIMLEGNDVSSGLKWALYSNSVVMTQTPTKTSWAMEELLEPWVHYVPLKDDLSDVEEKMQWIIDHDDLAQQIAYRGKLWIHDLVFHNDSSVDESLIFDEILKRTKAHFVQNPNMMIPSGPINIE